MNYLKYVFLLFTIMEISVGIITQMISIADIETIHNHEGVIQAPAMFYVKSFGNAVIGLGLISLWAFFKNSRSLRIGSSLAFAVFNALATYVCLAPEQQAGLYKIGGFGHLGFAILFAVMTVGYYRKIKE